MKKSKLDPKRARFVQEYLIDLNATQAAIRAGYSKKTANKVGPRLLVNVGIQRAIAAAQIKRSERMEITADRWLRELALVFFADMKDYLDVSEDTGAIRTKGFDAIPKDASRAIQSVKENRVIKENADGDSTTVYDNFEFKLHDKLKAGEMIGKALGFLKDKFEGDFNITAALSISDLKKSMAAYKKQ
jgi:phage terminase small subunit